jgi:hypothetical protein
MNFTKPQPARILARVFGIIFDTHYSLPHVGKSSEDEVLIHVTWSGTLWALWLAWSLISLVETSWTLGLPGLVIVRILWLDLI